MAGALEAGPAPGHASFTLSVDPCHRRLVLDLFYEPHGLSVDDGDGTSVTLPYRFQATVLAPNGSEVSTVVVDEPSYSNPLALLPAPGSYTLELELLEGAAVDYELRVRGFEVVGEPTCDLWLNEVELDPAGDDPDAQWVEFYNAGESDLDLSGWHVRALGNDSGHASFVVPNGTIVPAGGHRQVGLPDGPVLAHADLELHLTHPAGGVLDGTPRLTDEADDDRSWQRSPDGRSDWVLATATPGSTNVAQLEPSGR